MPIASCGTLGFVLSLAFACDSSAQAASARLLVRTLSDSTPVTGAIVTSRSLRVLTGQDGRAVLLLAPGLTRVVVRKLGFLPDTQTVQVRRGEDIDITVHLVQRSVELAPVFVATTRGTRRIEDEPTRVEVLNGDEVGEKLSMSPGNVSMLLSETSGVRVVSTAPALGGANVRIQGLRGRYTQLLSDGLPLFGLSTEGLGILQIPPLDLQRVEIIKGAASALYGPSALGGVVNFISRRPDDTGDLLINQTSLDATDLVVYDGHQVTPALGYTVLGGLHRQRAQDLDRDGWSDLAAYERLVVRPRLFMTTRNGGSAFVTVGFTREDREGGSFRRAVLPDGSIFPQNQLTSRLDGGSAISIPIDSTMMLSVRGSLTRQTRSQQFGDVEEIDHRSTAFGEVSVAKRRGHHDFLIGTAFQADRFAEPGAAALSYSTRTPALFAQHTWSPAHAFAATTSVRLDHHSALGTFLSPRLSLLTRPAMKGVPLTGRVSAGLGVYTPTPFTEQTEEVSLARVRPLMDIRAEHARNLGADIGGVFGSLDVNISVYASVIDRAVGVRAVPSTDPIPDVELVNAAQPTRNSGVELFARYRIDEFRVSATFARVQSTEWDIEQSLRREVPLTPRNSGGVVVSWESESGTRVGVEGYVTGSQRLESSVYRARSPAFTLIGALMQQRTGPALIFLNAENLLDVRQTRYDPLLLPRRGAGGRWTTDVWAPLEGRVFNIGIRLDRLRGAR